ncbi:MAG TPA: hypothetical protein VFH78_15320, partial [Candidatus Thermoplasmatota archaeon]|nr:hypothetical protein [Candidatus Thermoplasmatota archaeon]
MAAAIAAVMLFTIVPFSPAQAQGAGDIYVVQGEAFWRQSNFHSGSVNTTFIDNGTITSTLRVPVYNVGAAITRVPVYYWFHEAPDRTDCKLVDLQQGTANAPFSATVEFDPVPTRVLAAGAY